MTHFEIAQIISGLGVGFSLSVYQVNKRSSMLKLSMAATSLYAVSCFYLHANTGAVIDILSVLECYAFWKSNNQRYSLTLFVVFSVGAATATLITWAGIISILPFIASIVSSYALSQQQTKNIRRYALISSPFWLSYAVLIYAYPTIFINLVVFTSNVIGQYRFDQKIRIHSPVLLRAYEYSKQR